MFDENQEFIVNQVLFILIKGNDFQEMDFYGLHYTSTTYKLIIGNIGAVQDDTSHA